VTVEIGDVWFNDTWACLVVGRAWRGLRHVLILQDEVEPDSVGRFETLSVETISKNGGWRVFPPPKER
jgi:hypothetical protein